MEGSKAVGVLWVWEKEYREGLSAGCSESRAQLPQPCLSQYKVLMPPPGRCSELVSTLPRWAVQHACQPLPAAVSAQDQALRLLTPLPHLLYSERLGVCSDWRVLSHRPGSMITPVGQGQPAGTATGCRLGISPPQGKWSAYSFGPLPPTKCRSGFPRLGVSHKEQAGLPHSSVLLSRVDLFIS